MSKAPSKKTVTTQDPVSTGKIKALKKAPAKKKRPAKKPVATSVPKAPVKKKKLPLRERIRLAWHILKGNDICD
jgi:hypothetical protein